MCKDGLKNLSSKSVPKYPHCSPDHHVSISFCLTQHLIALKSFPTQRASYFKCPAIMFDLPLFIHSSLQMSYVFIIRMLTDSLTIYSNVQGELVTDRLKTWDCGREASLSWCLRTEMLLSAVVLLLCFCISLSIQTWSLCFMLTENRFVYIETLIPLLNWTWTLYCPTKQSWISGY